MLTRGQAEELDAADPLADRRTLFHLPDGVIYLDGNSLGALPRAVVERVARTVREEWGTGLIGSWESEEWIGLPARVGEKIGRLIGAEPGSVIACDSTTVNLYKVVTAACAMRPDRKVILTDTANFPTDLYAIAGIATLVMTPPDDLVATIDPEVAMVALTEVDYRTGRRHDLAEVTRAAHQAGALVVWDLAHSAGAFPVDLAGAEADFAVGCGYKFLNGGPGSPGYVYVAPRHQDAFRNPIAGWFGHRDPFEFSTEFAPAAGIGRAMVGTPPVLSMVALDEALNVFAGVEMEQVWDKAVTMTELFIELLEDSLEITTPRNPAQRGSQVAVRHPGARRLIEVLAQRGVIGDFRPPDLARFGFAPLYLRFVDVLEAATALIETATELTADRGPVHPPDFPANGALGSGPPSPS